MYYRTLGLSGLRVSAVGLGCMGMSHAYGAPADKKEMTELLAQAVHEMKKQGVNINQIAYTINIYPGVFSDIQFQATNVFLKKIEDLLLKITEKLL